MNLDYLLSGLEIKYALSFFLAFGVTDENSMVIPCVCLPLQVRCHFLLTLYSYLFSISSFLFIIYIYIIIFFLFIIMCI